MSPYRPAIGEAVDEYDEGFSIIVRVRAGSIVAEVVEFKAVA